MSDDLDIETDEEGNEYVRIPADQAKQQRDLARKAKDAEAAASEAAAAKRELAFLKAGVNAEDSKVAALFVKSYDGDLTADAIKAAYAELGVAEKPAETTTTPTPEQQAAAEAEAAQTAERAALARNSTGFAQAPPEDPRKLMREAVSTARDNGVNDQDALALGFAELVNAAGHGDRRARVTMPWDTQD